MFRLDGIENRSFDVTN